MNNSECNIIVVGGGLAGLSACIEALRQGAKVTLIEKCKIGGNSSRASSGISAAATQSQKKKGLIDDSVEIFFNDLMKSAQNDRVHNHALILSSYSASALEFIEELLNENLTNISRLGGHSIPRTHKFPPTHPLPIGFATIRACLSYLNRDEFKNKLNILESTTVVDFLTRTDENGRTSITGIKMMKQKCEQGCEQEEEEIIMGDAVILCTGGYSADLQPSGLINQYSPVAFKSMFTTNGHFATGDMLKAALKKGISTIDLEYVQLHPTGFVDLNNVDAKEKILCPEYLRGIGGILLNNKGERFVNELERRDLISTAILEHGASPEIWGLNTSYNATTLPKEKEIKIVVLLMNTAILKKIEGSSLKFYMGRKLIQEYSSLEEVARVMGTTQESLNLVMDKLLSDFENSVAANAFKKTDDPSKYYLAYVTPCTHYSMGGLEINEASQVLLKVSNQICPITNLFAAGEVSGGVQGLNRLAGCGLLESVVYGRLAGRHAAKLKTYKLSLKELLLNESSVELTVRNIDDIIINDECSPFLRINLPALDQISLLPINTTLHYTLPKLTSSRHSCTTESELYGTFKVLTDPTNEGYIDCLVSKNNPQKEFLLKLRPGDKIRVALN